jgi:EAL domain-containing protein (putative c-di-GMP-specific phosphodiesterase class I)/GGDEF domain-containing protein
VSLDRLDLIREAQRAIDQLEEFHRVETFVNTKTMVWSLMIVGALLIMMGLYHLMSPWHSPLHYSLASPWVPLIGGFFHVLMGLFFLSRDRLTTQLNRLVVFLEFVFYVTAIWFNGFTAMLILPAFIGLIHVLLAPQSACRVSTLVILVSLAVSLLHIPTQSMPFFLRILVSSLLVMMFLQIFSRATFHSARFSLRLMEKLKTMAQHLGDDLNRTLEERDHARSTDLVTGLLNWEGFFDAASLCLAVAPPKDMHFFIMMRLETHKELMAVVSDSESFYLIKHHVQRIERLFGSEAILGRIGRNDLIALVPSGRRSFKEMKAWTASLCDGLSQPSDEIPRSAHIKPRMGVSLWPRDGQTLTELRHTADISMMMAVERHLNTPVYFSSFMRKELLDRSELIDALNIAIKDQQFELYYQPIVNLANGRFSKAEALIRWTHPVNGSIPPDVFLPVAEETGQMFELTNWVLDQVIDDLAKLRQDLDPEFNVSLNIPPSYLDACCASKDKIQGVVSKRTQAVRGITLEITENAYLQATPEILGVLSQFKTMGFDIALDDFGVGYSCLSYLHTLPIDVIKIDKEFIAPIETSDQALTLCKTIIALGKAMGFSVVAEGLETERQVELVRLQGCDYGQGFFYSKPLRLDELECFIRKRDQGA